MQNCYNRGCTKQFNPDENNDEACVFHPGTPYFHDAYKIWQCCGKKVTDFTEFLNIKGCAKGPHNPIKPPPEVPAHPREEIPEVPVAPSVRKPVINPAESRALANSNDPLEKISLKLLPSFKRLETQAIISSNLEKATIGNAENESSAVTIGTLCKNASCNKPFEGPESLDQVCLFHPGVPIFHEGMKYWSCCQKKTSEFDNFLNQMGCEKGKHVYISTETKKSVKPRYDYHQTSQFMTIVFYVKYVSPENSFIEANSVKVRVHIEFQAKDLEPFDLEIETFGVMDVKASQATLGEVKLEIKMRKAEPIMWPGLYHIPPAPAPTE